MANKVDKPITPPNQLQALKSENNLPTEQPTKTSWARRIVQKITYGVKWIKDLITFNHDTKITTREIDESYIEPIEKKVLSNREFEQIVKKGLFSNDVFYTVNGDVNLKNIKKLPQHVKILGSCTVKNSPKLKNLSYNFIVTGNVNFYSCSSLKINTDDSKGLFYIHGGLIAHKCNSFDFITCEQKVSGIQGSITINSCDSFSYLPAGINNDVNIIKCKNFKELLAGNYHNLKIERCHRFNTMHPNTFTGNFILNNNKAFTSFPDNLTVKNLSVISCPIKDFISKIIISGNLLFKSCSSLQNISSSNVKLQGDIIIDSCKLLMKNIINLAIWPKWICSPKPDGSLRCMQILGNYPVIFIPSKIKLITPSAEHVAKRSFFNHFIFTTYSIIEHFADLAGCRKQITYPYINPRLSKQEISYIGVFLLDLRSTKDYKHGNRQLLANQVLRILSLFQEGVDENIRQMAMDIVELSGATCVDRTILALDDLLMLVEQKEAKESGDITRIRAVAKHLMIIDMSDEISMQYLADQIEHVLKARLKIRKLFNLPAGVQSMAYSHVSNFYFTRSHLRKIKENSTDKEVEKFIEAGNLNWNEFKKSKIFLPNFESLPTKYVDKKPVCCITYDNESTEMVEYKGDYYTYETLLRIYRNKQRITDKLELVDPNYIHKVVLNKDSKT